MICLQGKECVVDDYLHGRTSDLELERILKQILEKHRRLFDELAKH